MPSFYEIVELTNGDVALQRTDSETNEPLIIIHFSMESLTLLGDEKLMVARAMIEAGMDMVGDMVDQQADPQLEEHLELAGFEKITLH